MSLAPIKSFFPTTPGKTFKPVSVTPETIINQLSNKLKSFDVNSVINKMATAYKPSPITPDSVIQKIATPPIKSIFSISDPRYQNLTDLVQGPSLALGKFFLEPTFNFLSSAKELATGKPLPKLNLPGLTKNAPNFINGSAYSEKYVSAIENGMSQKDAYKQTLIGGIMDAVMLAEPIKGGLKFGITKTVPSALVDSSIKTVSKDSLFDYFSGRKTPAQLGFSSDVTKEITSKMKIMSTPEKTQFLQGFDLLDAKPSFVGKMFGVTEKEAQQIVSDAFGGPVRATSAGQLPGFRERPGQAPAFGLSTKEVESVGGAGEIPQKQTDLFTSENPKVTQVAEEYWNKVVKPNIDNGNAAVIGADDMKDYFSKDYNDANHPIYSRAAFLQYEKALAANPNPDVVFTGGGPASGKTELIVNALKAQGMKGVIYDSNMANYDGIKKQIEMARSAGKNVSINGIIPNVDSARTFSIQRENQIGRGISDATFSRGHAGFPNVALKLLEDGVIDAEDVYLLDTREITNFKTAFQKAFKNEYVDNPLEFLRELKYNEEEFKKLYAKENYNKQTGRRENGLPIRKGSGEASPQNRTNQGNANGRANERILAGTSKAEQVNQAAERAKAGEDFGPRTVQNKVQISDEGIPLARKISKSDKLIAEGKIRVVRRGNKDVYQYQKSGKWVDAQSEDSAVFQVTKEPYQPKPKVYSIEDQEKLSFNKAMLENVRESLAEHPARTLLKFIDKKEGQFEDFHNPDLAPNEFRRQQIIKKNKEIVKTAEIAFDSHPELHESFDNADVIKDVIADYKNQREIEKTLVATKNDLLKNLVPLSEKGPQKPPLKISPLDTTEGWGRSIETQVHQAIDMMNSEPFPINFSLPSIIEATVTPVKMKVHIIDTYLKSPELVMKKIGFGKEYQMLRDGQDAYWKELPKNIEKITNWLNRLKTKEAQRDVFRWLDGKHITLPFYEKQVAVEIKNWLKEWAKRLNLPEDDRITYYITHIFNREILEKEFDEELAKIITDKIPGEVYDPFLLKRLGKRGYIEDLGLALDAYAKRATRKVHMDPALNIIRDKAGASPEYSFLEKTQFKYIQRYIENVNMRPSELEEGLDNFIKSTRVGYKFGQRPTAVITKFFRQATFRGLIGGSVSSSIRNLSQGINTYSELGEKSTAIGYLKLFSRAAHAELAREGILNGGFVQDRVLTSGKKALERLDKGLFALFQLAERINRGAAYFGAKSKFYDTHKQAENATRETWEDYEQRAIAYAKQIVRKTQFSYDAIDTPVGLNSNIAKTMFQLQTFTTKQLEFLGGKVKGSFKGNEKAKNAVGLIRYALAGLAFVYTTGKAFGMDPKELLPWYRFDWPPSLNLPVELTKAILNTPDKYGNKRDLGRKVKDVDKAALGLVPGGSQIKKTYEGSKSLQEGGSFTSTGRLQFIQGTTFAQKVQAVIFGKYAGQNAQDYFDKEEINKKEKEAIKPIYDKIQETNKTSPEEAKKMVNDLSDADYETYKKYRTQQRAQQTIEGKKKLLPKYLEIQELNKTDPIEAKRMVEALSDDEYKYYKLIKEQIKSSGINN